MVLGLTARRFAHLWRVFAKHRSLAALTQSIACGLLIIVALALTSPVFADDESLQEVTISANRLEEELPQELARFGIRVDTITAAQIKNGGYTDVAQALQSLAPGLFISPKNGPFDYVDASFQGSSAGDILWLVDGVRINNRFYSGTTPLDTMLAAMVERIEILEGRQALFYGTQAVSGAVNFVTKALSDQPDGALTAAADSNNGRHSMPMRAMRWARVNSSSMARATIRVAISHFVTRTINPVRPIATAPTSC